MHDSSIFVPYFGEGDEYTDLVFYPIYSPSEFVVGLAFHDQSGNRIAAVDEWLRFDGTPDRLLNASLGCAVADHLPPADAARVRGISIVKNWTDRTRIPTRLKFGLNVGLRTAPWTSDHSASTRARNAAVLASPVLQWSPILIAATVVVVTNFLTRREYLPPYRAVRLLPKLDDESLHEPRGPPCGQERTICGRTTSPCISGRRTGWATIVADNPSSRRGISTSRAGASALTFF